MHIVHYADDFIPVERCERRLDGVVDVWLRRDPRETENGHIADEIYLTFPIDEAPTLEALKTDIDRYFEADATPETTLQDVIEALNELAGIVLGGE